MNETATYDQELAKCAQRTVAPSEFRRCALAAGWDERTVELFLKPPHIGDPVKVGREALILQP